jgi:recombination associated protein RdgC
VERPLSPRARAITKPDSSIPKRTPTLLEALPLMPALKGSLTYARYYIDGEVPDDFRDKFVKAIRLRAMKPLEPDEDVAERSGWCRMGEPFEVDLGYEDVFYNNYLNLGFRADKWVIPGPMLRAKLRDAEASYLQKKGRERLTRKERTELKELVAKKLRRQVVPAMRVVDMSWSLEEGVVRFFSQSPKQGALLAELFTKTFALKLVPETPYTLAVRLGISKAQDKLWEQIEPTSLALAEEGS